MNLKYIDAVMIGDLGQKGRESGGTRRALDWIRKIKQGTETNGMTNTRKRTGSF